VSALVRSLEEISDDVVLLECVHCAERHQGAEFEGMGEPLACIGCGLSGFIPRRANQMADRFPPALAQNFTPLPNALLDRAEELSLGAHELLVVWALERHRRVAGDEVFPSRQRLAQLTRLSEPSVGRATGKLARLGLIARRQGRWRDSGRRAVTRYDLDPLWRTVAEQVSGAPEISVISRPEIREIAQPEPRLISRPEIREIAEVDVAQEEQPAEEQPAEEKIPEGVAAASRLPTAPDLDFQEYITDIAEIDMWAGRLLESDEAGVDNELVGAAA
jgi:hypothetical protein